MKRLVALTIAVVFLGRLGTGALAAGEQTKPHGSDPRMLVLHRVMQVFAQSQARVNKALKSGDSAAIEAETGMILEQIPDLKKSRPHKNLNKLSDMRKITEAFENDIRITAAMAKKGNLAGAATVFARAEKKCDECHAKFRD